MNAPIFNMLKGLFARANTRFCMPGHKGRRAGFDCISFKYDITELNGADNLYAPKGAIAESERLNAEYTGAKDSFFLVNGGTGGVISSILTVLSPGDKLICARDIHLSAVHAFALAGARPIFVSSGVYSDGSLKPLSIETAEQAVREHSGAKALYVTYPNYYGLCCNLEALAKTVHNAGMALICDASHAAAFDYSNLLPISPARAGCDIWTVSLHKTLPAMNQCAMLSIGKKSGLDAQFVKSRINMVQTTSPSYVLLSSADYALSYMRGAGNRKLAEVISLVQEFSERIEKIGGYSCCFNKLPEGAYNRDALKLRIDVSARGVTGFEAAAALEGAGVYVECADLRTVLLICTVYDERRDFERLLGALKRVEVTGNNIKYLFSESQIIAAYFPRLEEDIYAASRAKRQAVPLCKAQGRVSAVCAGAYPPGVPVILPGSIITQEAASYLAGLKSAGYALFGCGETIEVTA